MGWRDIVANVATGGVYGIAQGASNGKLADAMGDVDFRGWGESIFNGSAFTDRNMLQDPFGDVAAAEAQQEAQKTAFEQQMDLATRAQQYFEDQSAAGQGYIQQYGDMAGQAIGAGRATALEDLQRGQNQAAVRAGAMYDQAGDTLARSYAQGRGDVTMGYAGGQQALGQGYSDATGAVGAGYGQARDDLGRVAALQGYAGDAARAVNAYDVAGQQPGRLDAMMEGGLYSNFEADPGYQFRKQQGEEAINRAASASGGRLSSATMQKMADYNQGLASQEFANYAQRQNAQAGFAGQGDSRELSALMNQAGRSDQAALAAQSNQMNLAGMGYGAQGQMAGMAAAQGNALGGLASQYGQNAAGMYVGQGQNLGAMAGQYGSQAAGMQQDLGNLLSGQAFETGQNAAGINMQGAASLADIYANIGSNMANIGIGAAANNSNIASQMAGYLQNNAQYGGMGEQAQANTGRGIVDSVLRFKGG